MSDVASRGRPPASSRDILQDAAFDLFLERSYAQTNIADITQRAGVSRATFFNYFPSKSDVFWVDLDDGLEQFHLHLSHPPPSAQTAGPTAGVGVLLAALDALAERLGDSNVPFALTHYDLLGSVDELQASAVARISKLARQMTAALERYGFPPARARAASYAFVAGAISACQEWADAGTQRGPLKEYLRRAVAPLVDAFSQETGHPNQP